jgi:hypothetical protein
LVVHPDDPVVVEIAFSVLQWNDAVASKGVVFGIGIHRSDGLVVHGSNTHLEGVDLSGLYGRDGALVRRGTVRYEITRLGLLDGTYHLDVAVHGEDGYPFDYHKRFLTFAVRSPLRQLGVWVPEHRWCATRDDTSAYDG